jgi:hypothetical protein
MGLGEEAAIKYSAHLGVTYFSCAPAYLEGKGRLLRIIKYHSISPLACASSSSSHHTPDFGEMRKPMRDG